MSGQRRAVRSRSEERLHRIVEVLLQILVEPRQVLILTAHRWSLLDLCLQRLVQLRKLFVLGFRQIQQADILRNAIDCPGIDEP